MNGGECGFPVPLKTTDTMVGGSGTLIVQLTQKIDCLFCTKTISTINNIKATSTMSMVFKFDGKIWTVIGCETKQKYDDFIVYADEVLRKLGDDVSSEEFQTETLIVYYVSYE